jgi:hypothetical protein
MSGLTKIHAYASVTAAISRRRLCHGGCAVTLRIEWLYERIVLPKPCASSTPSAPNYDPHSRYGDDCACKIPESWRHVVNSQSHRSATATYTPPQAVRDSFERVVDGENGVITSSKPQGRPSSSGLSLLSLWATPIVKACT